jgi:hypothetical protein
MTMFVIAIAIDGLWLSTYDGYGVNRILPAIAVAPLAQELIV